jgi:4-diphosphocytidyl-2-C-methyl-D-erythritol kinase
MTAYESFAPAKINLSLHVGRPRADGLHPIESIVMFADVGDVVRVAPADDLSLSCSGPFASALAGEANNLVLRAARALADASGAKPGARIALEKALPIASGIGGGSSDAAATLRALDVLWGLRAGEAALMRVAGTLGSDAPACVAARAGMMSGAGEVFTPIAAPALHAVLVNPGVASPTGPVYRAFDAQGLGGGFCGRDAPSWTSPAEAIADLAGWRNDLSAPACALAPAIGAVIAALEADPRTRLARMSGSGATCFALVDSAAHATGLAEAIAAQAPGWWVRPACLGPVDAAARPV